MKRILAALALLLIPAVASAGWQIQNRDDGGAEWESDDGDTFPVGGIFLQVQVTDLSTASTYYVSSPVPGEIRDVVSVLQGSDVTAGGAAVLRVFTSLAASAATSGGADQFTPVTSSDTTDNVKLTIAQSSEPGQVDQMVGFSTYAVSQASIANTSVDERGVIAVHTDGGNSDSREATVLITIYPK